MPRPIQICLAVNLSTASIISNSIPLWHSPGKNHNISAINIACHSATIVACHNQPLDLSSHATMNSIHSAMMRMSRKRDQSVVVPAVLIDAPARSRKESRSNQIEGRRRAREQEQSKSCLRDYEFRYFIDRQGRQHFNFRQRVWLDASVQMAYTRVYSVALKTLAVNLLMMAMAKRDCHAATRLTARQAGLLAPSFVRECLLDAPDEAWALPRTTIEAWLESRLRGRLGSRAKRRDT